jgi:hypothetical protein
MKRQQILLLVAALALMAGAAGFLIKARSHQRLGAPGVTTTALADSERLKVTLPEHVLDYTSEWIDVDEVTLGTLPKDTSFGERLYKARDGFSILLSVVLMGTDRTSLHKPQYCLEGQGYRIDHELTKEDSVRVERPREYELPIVRLVSTKQVAQGEQPETQRAVYVYWYVADDAVSATKSGFERMWYMARKMVTTGELQRWAYVSCYTVCRPGQEDAVYERIKQFIAAATPGFQKYAPPAPATVASRQ